MNRRVRAIALVAMTAFGPCPALATTTIPYWARKYDVSCSRCHVSVPKLNRFGFEFLARGYRMPPDSGFTARRTVPFAVWVSGRSDSRR